MIRHYIRRLSIAILLALLAASVPSGAAPPILRLATTTSTDDSGLLKALLPAFEATCGCRVEVIAVGTGQALEIARRGDADVVLVHARKAEDEFVAEHHARERHDVMYNDFVIVGPKSDPARVAAVKLARDAFGAIAKAGAAFVSRGDRSGTETAEKAIWSALRIDAAGRPWYRSLGQGMGETLVTANEMAAYTLADRGTWLSMRGKLPALRLLVGGATMADNSDPSLRNPYGVMAVNPDVHPGVNFALASRFVEWILSGETQRAIGEFGRNEFGQPLFYAAADDPRTTREVAVIAGATTKTFTLRELQALPRVTLTGHSITGVSKGPLGRHDWAGASLKDLLVAADPRLAQRAYAGGRIVLTSSDNWTATVCWDELFGALPRGAQVYNTKGCNECHGVLAEGSAPPGKRAVPALAGKSLTIDRMLSVLRTGHDAHGGLNPYTDGQLPREDVQALLQWLPHPVATGAAAPTRVPVKPILLAYERDGKPLAGRDGLIQLVVGEDEFAGRYSHWVKTITVTR